MNLHTILMDAQMVLSQDLYHNVFFIRGYNMNSVAYTFLCSLENFGKH